jgi:hypothetical protein
MSPSKTPRVDFSPKTPLARPSRDSELIAIDPKTHELLGGHDDRRNYGKAAGY